MFDNNAQNCVEHNSSLTKIVTSKFKLRSYITSGAHGSISFLPSPEELTAKLLPSPDAKEAASSSSLWVVSTDGLRTVFTKLRTVSINKKILRMAENWHCTFI